MAILDDIRNSLSKSKNIFSNITTRLTASANALGDRNVQNYLADNLRINPIQNVKDFVNEKRNLYTEVDTLSDEASKIKSKPVKIVANLGLGQTRTGAMALTGTRDFLKGSEEVGRGKILEGGVKQGFGGLQLAGSAFRTTAFGQGTTLAENIFFETMKNIREKKPVTDLDFRGSAKDLFISDALGIREKHPYAGLALDLITNLALGKGEDRLATALRRGDIKVVFDTAAATKSAKEFSDSFKTGLNKVLKDQSGKLDLNAKIGGEQQGMTPERVLDLQNEYAKGYAENKVNRDIQGANLQDLRTYEKALNVSDLNIVNQLSAKYPSDSRFQIHKTLSSDTSGIHDVQLRSPEVANELSQTAQQDYNVYKRAVMEKDIKTIQDLASKYPNDLRFQLHKSFGGLGAEPETPKPDIEGLREQLASLDSRIADAGGQTKSDLLAERRDVSALLDQMGPGVTKTPILDETAETRLEAPKGVLDQFQDILKSERGSINFGADVGTENVKGSNLDDLISEARKYKSAENLSDELKPLQTDGRFNFVHNNVSSLKVNPPTKTLDEFGQRMEPAGKYMNLLTDRGVEISSRAGIPNMEYGKVDFVNPVIIDKTNLTSAQWKKVLSERYGGLTGEGLSRAMIKDGYDGIITVERASNGKVVPSETIHFDRLLTKSQLTDIRNKANTPSNVSGGAKTDIGDGRQRSFLKTVAESANTTSPVRKAVRNIDPQTYDVLPNAVATKSAQDLINRSTEEARNLVFSDAPESAEKSATAIELARKYEREGDTERAVEVIGEYDRQLREAGRFIQAASLWNNLSPETLVRQGNKISKKYAGHELDKQVQAEVLRKMQDIKTMPIGPDKDAKTLEVLNYIASKIPTTKSEMFDAYRYQNMLSGPKTHERNTYQNLFNTLITRPYDLAIESGYDIVRHPFNPLAREAHFSEVPQYYKSVFTSLPNAIHAFKAAFSQAPDPTKFDLNRGDTVIEGLRARNAPKPLTAVPRFMEAQDKFFSALIATGEKNRLLSQGVEEGKANKAAKNLAEKYLLRSKLGKADNDPALVQALDSLGSFALQGRKLPVVGKAFGWVVPFITTPINAGKAMIERSPLGFIGSKTDASTAKAIGGTMVSAMGAILAMQDKTTWDAPTDPKAKELFYASGKKPFSVLIEGTWVPMWYFGPFSLALAIPAAVKNRYADSSTAPTDSEMKKLLSVANSVSRFISSQSALSNVGSFFRTLDGDEDYSVEGILANTSSQVIPLGGLQRYISQIVDPIFRKGSDFEATYRKIIPGMSKELEPYTLPDGTPSTRSPLNYFLPYDLGFENDKYSKDFDERTKKLQDNSIKREEKKSTEKKNGPKPVKPKSTSTKTVKKTKRII